MPFFNETQFVHLAFIMSIYLLAHTSTNKKYKQCIHKVGINLSDSEWPSEEIIWNCRQEQEEKSNNKEMALVLR